MSRTRNKRRKMKPYQVKLRVIGVLSLVVSMLVLWLPVPSRAVDTAAEVMNWPEKFDYERDDPSSTEGFLDLKQYLGYSSDQPGDDNNKNVLTAEGVLKIPEEAVLRNSAGSGANQLYKTRIGKESSEIFRDKSWLKSVDLSKVIIDSTALTLANLFNGCIALEEVFFPESVTSLNVTDTTGMFKNCSSLTKLDLSRFDLSSLTTDKANDMFANCSSLDVIESPVNVVADVELPGWFRFEGNSGSFYDVNHLPTEAYHNSESTGKTAAQSLTLTRVKDIRSLKVAEGTSEIVTVTGDTPETKEDTTKSLTITAGDTKTITVALTPETADNLKATVCLKDAAGATFVSVNPADAAAPTTEAEITLDTDAKTGTFTLEGKAEGTAVVKIQATSQSGGRTVYRIVELTVNVTEHPVEEVTLDQTNVTIDAAATTPSTLTATITPVNAGNQNVEWISGDDTIVMVTGGGTDGKTGTLIPVGIGTTTVTARAVGDITKKATCTVTVRSTYTLTPDDSRGDAINHVSFTDLHSVEKNPVKGNRKLEIKNPANAALASAFSNTADDKKSFFTLQVKDGDTVISTPADEDYGDVTIRMALPGKMWGKPGLHPQIYAGSAADSARVNTNRITLDGYVEGIEFTIPVGNLANEYAIILTDERTGLSITTDDQRTEISQKAVTVKTDKTTQNRGLILHIEDVTAQADSEAPTLYNYIQSHSTYKDYATKRYYLIYLTDAQNNPVTDFTELDVSLSLPSVVSYDSPYFVFLTEKADGTAATTPGYTKELSGSTQSVRFQPTHFSEFAVLDNTDPAVFTIRSTHSGGITGSTTAISGNNVTQAATVPAGHDAEGTVPAATPGEVTITATPGTNYHVSGWLRNGVVDTSAGTASTYAFTPSASTIITALFEQDSNSGGNASTGGSTTGPTYTVTIDPLPSAAGMATADKQSYSQGETATLTATPNDGYTFLYWADAGNREPVSSAATITMTMDGNKHLLAVFGQQGEVAGAERTIDVNANVEVSVPPVEATVTVPEVKVNVPDINANINVSIPDVNVYLNGAGGLTAVAGTSGSFIPVRIGNSIDMPRTGIGDIYRMLFAMLLVLSGTVEIMLSIPAKKRKTVHHRIS